MCSTYIANTSTCILLIFLHIILYTTMCSIYTANTFTYTTLYYHIILYGMCSLYTTFTSNNNNCMQWELRFTRFLTSSTFVNRGLQQMCALVLRIWN